MRVKRSVSGWVRFCLLAILGLLATVGVAQESPPPPPSPGQVELQRGMERVTVLRQRGEWERALRLLEQLKDKHPNQPGIWYGLGEIYGADGALFDQKKAIEAFNRFMDLSIGAASREQRLQVDGFILDLEDGKKLKEPGGGAAAGGRLSDADALEWATIRQIAEEAKAERQDGKRQMLSLDLAKRLQGFCERNPDHLAGWIALSGAALDVGLPLEGYHAGQAIARLQAAGQTHEQALEARAALNRRGWTQDPTPMVTGELREPLTVDLGGGVKLELVWVPAGRFLMGWSGREEDEQPIHPVTITEGFHMGKYEVTQEQWQRVMGVSPSYFKNAGPRVPVEQVSWDDCQEFIRKVNALVPGGGFRLPTESEWEWACPAQAAQRNSTPARCGSKITPIAPS